MKFKSKWLAIVGMLVIGSATALIAARSTYLIRYLAPGSTSQVWLLQQSGAVTQTGALKFGNNEDAVTTLPTTTTADSFGVKVPFVNTGSGTTSRGQLILANSTSTTVGAGQTGIVLSTTSWIGVCDGAYTAGSKGWMTIDGYAAILTSGTVSPGDLITSTDTVTGYSGRIAGGTSVLEGSVVGKAVSVGTAAGGLTVIRLGN